MPPKIKRIQPDMRPLFRDALLMPQTKRIEEVADKRRDAEAAEPRGEKSFVPTAAIACEAEIKPKHRQTLRIVGLSKLILTMEILRHYPISAKGLVFPGRLNFLFTPPKAAQSLRPFSRAPASWTAPPGRSPKAGMALT